MAASRAKGDAAHRTRRSAKPSNFLWMVRMLHLDRRNRRRRSLFIALPSIGLALL